MLTKPSLVPHPFPTHLPQIQLQLQASESSNTLPYVLQRNWRTTWCIKKGVSGTLKGGGGEGLKVSAAAMRLYLPSHLATLQRFAYACARNCVSACVCECVSASMYVCFPVCMQLYLNGRLLAFGIWRLNRKLLI